MELLGKDHDIFAVEGLVFQKVDLLSYHQKYYWLERRNSKPHIQVGEGLLCIIKILQIQIVLEEDEIRTVYDCN